MIRSKKELKFYIQADLMIRTGAFTRPIKKRIMDIIVPDYIFQYIKASRQWSYYSHQQGINHILSNLYALKRHRLGMKLGFSISFDEIGYGLHIPHYGTIVVGSGNKIGNYAVLHTSTCITAGKKSIGNGLYLSTGAKIINDITIGNGVSVGANSVVNSNIPSYCMIAGAPARRIKDSDMWYYRDSIEYARRVQECEKLREQYQL